MIESLNVTTFFVFFFRTAHISLLPEHEPEHGVMPLEYEHFLCAFHVLLLFQKIVCSV